KKNISLEKLQKAFEEDGGSYSISETGNSEEKEKPSEPKEYYCPMHCEGDKTYDQPGRCPVCNMHLKEVTTENKDSDKQVFAVHGMTCQGCKSHVESILKNTRGVKEVTVDLEKGEAQVASDKPLSLKKLQKAFEEDSGSYQITNKGEKPAEAKKKPKGKGTGVFYCPMHCEGDKTYDQAGDCPVCGMDLVEEVNLQPQKTQYICPMRCEGDKTYDQPGDCPVCGMDLVPVEPDVSAEEKKYKNLLNKFWWSLVFTIPIFIISMSDMLSHNPLLDIMDKKYWHWTERSEERRVGQE